MHHDHNQHDSGCELLLLIVARGTAIITEIYRLIDLIPEPFLQRQYNLGPLVGPKERQHTLDDIVGDFSYFKDADSFEARIEQNPILKQADELFCDTYLDILTRFYLTFESIQRYASDLNRFIQDLEEDVLIGQTLDTLLLNAEHRQLLCEAYFQLGYMLLLVDLNLDGTLRERLIVSHYRYSSYKSSPTTELDGACNLMRDTHFRCEGQKIYKNDTLTMPSRRPYHRPAGYPEKLFARAEVNQSVVNTLIAKLQIIDIYNQTLAVFPHPDHRSNALARQSSILYVLLYFCPSILKTQRSRMREITDKFFCDNWVLDIFMGERVNLIEAWEPYKAAKESLLQIFDTESVRNLAKNFNSRYQSNFKQLSRQYLLEGWLNEDTFLANNNRILNCIRDSNVVLRWFILHTSSHSDWQLPRSAKALSAIVCDSSPNKKDLCVFLQNLAVLEKKFTQFYERLIMVRDGKLKENKLKACETLEELISIFNDSKPMRWVKRGANQSLATILEKIETDVDSLDFEAPNCRDQVIKVINQLDSARGSYSDDKSLQIVQLFMDTKQSLLYALRYQDLNPDLKVILQQVGDFSYAWRLMPTYFTDHLQQTIKDDPISMFGFEAIIIKLAAAFETQLLRVQQVESNADLVSVSQYYSTKLVMYIRDVLQIIPFTILELIASIISIQTNNILGYMPSKIHLDNLKDYALPEQRFRMLELTRTISRYARGIMMMPNTTIGLVRINSKELLEDGMRRELSKRMLNSIQGVIQFDENNTKVITGSPLLYRAKMLLQKLEELTSIIRGYKRSLEYIQDFLNIYGLKMWQEELSRLIRYNIEQAVSVMMERVDLSHVSDTASIDSLQTNLTLKAASTQNTRCPASDSNFIERILNEVLRITSPRETIYDEQTNTWFEQKAAREQVLDSKLFKSLLSSLGVAGLNGIDKMCCCLIMVEVQRLSVFLDESMAKRSVNPENFQQNQVLLEAILFTEELRAQSTSHAASKSASSSHKQLMTKALSVSLSKLAPYSEHLTNRMLSIGQLQAIRMSINSVLSANCRCEARHLYSCLEAMNTTLLATLKHGRRQSSNQQKHSLDNEVDEHKDESADSASGCSLEQSQLVFELTNHTEYVGISDPISKIYTFALQRQQQRDSMKTRNEQLSACDGAEPSEFSLAIGLIFLLLIEQSSKFHFSRSISGFIPRPAKSFYETGANVDGQPFFYSIITLLNHLQPSLTLNHWNEANNNKRPACPLESLLELMSSYVKIAMGQPIDGSSIKPQDLTLEVVNVILSMIELMRIAPPSIGRDPLARTYLPNYLLDTFQFTICHLNQAN